MIFQDNFGPDGALICTTLNHLGLKRDFEKPLKCPNPNCIKALRSLLGWAGYGLVMVMMWMWVVWITISFSSPDIEHLVEVGLLLALVLLHALKLDQHLEVDSG